MIHIHEHRYEYLEEINVGALKHIPDWNSDREGMVLDVGCGSGALSEAIKCKGYTVWGIEDNDKAAESASKRIPLVIKADLTAIEKIEEQLGEIKFDSIVLSDVLEHIYDPFLTLEQYLPFLKEGGRFLISVPNALVWENRLNFLFGRFQYQDTGVLDRTHIRFFTFKSAKEIVTRAGCYIEEVDYTPHFVRAVLPAIKKLDPGAKPPREAERRQLIDSPFYRLYMKCIYPIEYFVGRFWKPLFAFRIIIVGRKPDQKV